MSALDYNDDFYDYNTVVATRSATKVIPILLSFLPSTASLVDFGCARGAWLRIWKQIAAQRILGIDGNFVDRNSLVIAKDEFRVFDLSKPIDLGESFDLVESLEVAEHIPVASARTFVETLTRHSDHVFFSAAPPGQGGEHHINEQPYDYWRDHFGDQGYAMFDCIRPQLAHSGSNVQPWYRYNCFLFVKEERVADLPIATHEMRVAPDRRVADISPMTYKIRKGLVRSMPRAVQDRLAQMVSKRYGAG